MNNTVSPTLPLRKDSTPRPVDGDRHIKSEALLGPEGRVIIEHDGQHYLLRRTNAGKLILTK